MYDTKALFAEYVSEGTYLDFANDAHAVKRFPFGPSLTEQFGEYCAVINMQAEVYGDPTRLHFGLIDSPLLGAWAYACADSQYLIAISVGAYLRLQAFFNLLAVTASFNTVPTHQPPNRLSFIDVIGIGNVRDIPKLQHVPQLFPRAADFESSQTNLEYLLKLDLPFVDERHRFDATTLLGCGLAYLFWHEVAHIVCGHLDADGDGAAGVRKAERPVDLGGESGQLSQGYELLADHYAALILAQNVPAFSFPPAAPKPLLLLEYRGNSFSTNFAPPGEGFVYRAAYAILATLSSLELTWSRLQTYTNASHPHPEIRYAKMAASGMFLLHTDPRIFATPKLWSSLGDEPPSMDMTWHIAWSRARHDLALALTAWELPNVLNWSNRTDISAFRRETDAAAARFAAARERSVPHGKPPLSLDAYWDDAYLRPMWMEVPGVDLPQSVVAEDLDDVSGQLIGVYEGEVAPLIAMAGELAQRLGTNRVLTLVHSDLRVSDEVTDRTISDVRTREEDRFFKQCSIVIGKCTGFDGLAFSCAGYRALDRNWIRSLILVGPPAVLDVLDAALRAEGDLRLQELIDTGRLKVVDSFSYDLIT